MRFMSIYRSKETLFTVLAVLVAGFLKAHNVAEFVLRPEGGATRVTWTMRGANSYLGKMIHTVIDMDQMVGRDFEAGLASLKSLTEG